MYAILFLLLLGGPEPVGRITHPPIRETSGVVASRKHPGIYWVHSDSGNPAAIYAIRKDGSLVREFPVAVPNMDWEDIATDDEGHLYLGDIGNNGNLLPLRLIYQLDEPDPSKPAPAPLPVTKTSVYRFPSIRDRFDAEGLFIDGDQAIVVSKSLSRRPAELFAIPLKPPAPLTRPALPKKIGTLTDFIEPATGADLSADGKRLAVCSYGVTRVYQRAGPGKPWKLDGEVRYDLNDPIEAVCWDGPDLLLVGEGQGVYTVAASAWKRAK